jgi:hypothetical protein
MATPIEVEQATNPEWPPVYVSVQRKPFRYAPPIREFDGHPAIVALTEALKVGNYSFKTFKNYKQALITLIRYMSDKPIDEINKAQYQKYLLFLIEKKLLSSATINVHINAYKFYKEKYCNVIKSITT